MEIEYLNIMLESLPKGASILDLGCGTGEPIAKFFIEHGHKVTGIDGSRKMIEFCQKRFPEMTWIVGDIRGVDLRKEFDAVIAFGSAFLHFSAREQRSMFPIVSSHCKVGGLLLFSSGDREGEEYGTMGGYKFYHASLAPDEYKDLLEHHGFKIVLNRIADPECGGQSIWLTEKVK